MNDYLYKENDIIRVINECPEEYLNSKLYAPKGLVTKVYKVHGWQHISYYYLEVWALPHLNCGPTSGGLKIVNNTDIILASKQQRFIYEMQGPYIDEL